MVLAARLDGICSKVEVAPQGFVNLSLDDEFVASSLQAQARDPRRGVDRAAPPQRIVVDYSAPNVAKEMHVGHLRTTVIGDALCRLLDFAGHTVLRENHIGDWGTNFGMLIEHLLDLGEEEAAHELSVGDLDMFYRQARAAFDASPAFQERSRKRVVLLQSGDAETMRLWRILVEESLRYFEKVYARLGVLLTRDDIVGESYYNPILGEVVEELRAAGLLVVSDGALCAFPPGYTNREGEPLPLIVRKSDGGYGYAATDLAALRDRFGRLRRRPGALRGRRPAGAAPLHGVRRCPGAGWLPSRGQAVHVTFGSMLGRTARCSRLVPAKPSSWSTSSTRRWCGPRMRSVTRTPTSAGRRSEVARMVGIGALKYADLSTDRSATTCSTGIGCCPSTATPLLTSSMRGCAACRSSGAAGWTRLRIWREWCRVAPAEPAERPLALALLGFPEAVEATMETWSPHKLCAYLYDLAGLYTTFFETCPVLRAPDHAVRDSRLVLCGLTASILETGLGLLGIEVPDRM